MIEGLPDVPPAIPLLLAELGDCDSWGDVRKMVKSLLPELRVQSEAFWLESARRSSYSASPGLFQIHLQGGLDVLTREGCMELSCRIAVAERVARSVGLIADRVWLTDTLTERFLDFGRVTNAKLDEVIRDMIVVGTLLPLIRAGIVRFRSPTIATCNHCLNEFRQHVRSISDELARKFRRDFRLEWKGEGRFSVYTGRCFDPPLLFVGNVQSGDEAPSLRALAQEAVEEAVHSTMWAAREAAMTGGAVFTNSRVGLSGLLSQDGRLQDKRSLMLLDRERSFSIPWVSELSASQIVQLRNEAAKALPAFRNLIATALSGSKSPEDDGSALEDVIAELREQAEDVRAELEVKRSHSARYWKTTYGLLGLGLSAYGVASDQVLPGVAGLLPVLQLLIGHKTGHEAEAAKLKTRPGYVLVKAKDLLSHAH